MKKINTEDFYTVKEVVDMGIMTANNLDTKKQMLLRFIRENRIPAKNLGGEKKPRYVIQGKYLIEYTNSQIKPNQYIKK